MEQNTEQMILCDLCPRGCRIAEGKSGTCFVRENHGGELILTVYGRSTGFCIDPIEKKPLYHFLPGTGTLSFGTVGCNLGCLHCQNHDISRCRSLGDAHETASPERIAETAVRLGCESVSFTYNEPIVWSEFAVDTAAACHERGIKTVAVTNGYIMPEPGKWFFAAMDAVNIDLKAFSEEFYKKITGATLKPVLETLKYVVKETDVWLEITNLIIPGENDRPEDIRRMCDWIVHELGPDVPLHFSAFHPTHRLSDHPPTSPTALFSAREIAKNSGIRYIYLGNLPVAEGQGTDCPGCQRLLMERTGYGTVPLEIDLPPCENGMARCRHCGESIPGVFPPQWGSWGNRRQRVTFHST